MKKLDAALGHAVWCVIGVFAGTNLYRYWDYKRRPGLYAMESAPRYTGILATGAATAVLIAVLLLLRLLLRKRTGRNKRLSD